MPLSGHAIGIERILLTCDAVGGVWTQTLELVRGLSKLDLDIMLVVLGPSPTPDQLAAAQAIARLELIDTGLPLDWLARSEQALEAGIDALQALAAERDADLVHLHAPGLTGRRRWSMPVVTTAHSCVGTWWREVRGGPLPRDLAWRARMTGEGLAIADVVTAPSRSFARLLGETYTTARPIAGVWNGLPSIGERAAGISDQERELVLTAGRLWDAGKDVGTLDLAAEASRMPIVAAGATVGPHGESVATRNLQLTGVLSGSALAALMERTAVFVSSAVYEPFGLAVLEAARAGAALVLADTSTFRELWSGAALLVPARRPDEFSAAIELALERRQELAEAARRRAARYSAERMVGGMIAAYGAAAAQCKTRQAA